jgi:hypothetical protein
MKCDYNKWLITLTTMITLTIIPLTMITITMITLTMITLTMITITMITLTMITLISFHCTRDLRQTGIVSQPGFRGTQGFRGHTQRVPPNF